MKKNLTLLTLIFAVTTVSAQRVATEDFNYNSGKLVTISNGTWTHGSGNTISIAVASGNLTYPGYISDSSANSSRVRLDTSAGHAEDAFIKFAKQDSGTVYYSFLLNVPTRRNLVGNKAALGQYFIAFLPTGINVPSIAGVAIRKGSVAKTVNLGIFAREDSTKGIVWSPVNYPIKTTLLVRVGYQFMPGDNNNVASLWVNPPIESLQPAPDAQAIDIDTGDSLKLSKLALFQRSLRTPACFIDAIRISTQWSDAILPLRLLSFNVINSNGYASLQWQTSDEINVKGFEVQKSFDAHNFISIGSIPARNVSDGSIYTYTDPKELAGKAYYRLKMLDNDGRSTFSGIVSIDGKLPMKVSVFPNPVTDNLSISHPKAETGAFIRIISTNGAIVATYPVVKDAIQTSLNISKLGKGNYIVVFQNAKQQQTIKILKQ